MEQISSHPSAATLNNVREVYNNQIRILCTEKNLDTVYASVSNCKFVPVQDHLEIIAQLSLVLVVYENLAH